MGGCYDDRYYAARVSTPRTDSIVELIQKFFRTNNRAHLFEAYKQYSQNNDSGFIKKVTDAGNKEIKKEFSDYEIESKLELSVEGKVSLTDIMDCFEFTPAPSARFLKDASNVQSSGVNYFFGTDDGEEQFVIIHKADKWYIKEKGSREHYNFGISGEEYVLKRPETRIETNPLEVAKIITAKYADGRTRYQGGLSKDRVEAHLLNSVNGRIYSLTVDRLSREDRQQLLQFEVEYAGYMPGFKSKLNDERAIVSDVVSVLKQVIFLYSDIELPGGQQLKVLPSQQRKYDFVLGESGAKALVRVK